MDGLWNVQGSVSFGSDGVLVELNFESLMEGVIWDRVRLEEFHEYLGVS